MNITITFIVNVTITTTMTLNWQAIALGQAGLAKGIWGDSDSLESRGCRIRIPNQTVDAQKLAWPCTLHSTPTLRGHVHMNDTTRACERANPRACA